MEETLSKKVEAVKPATPCQLHICRRSQLLFRSRFYRALQRLTGIYPRLELIRRLREAVSLADAFKALERFVLLPDSLVCLVEEAAAADILARGRRLLPGRDNLWRWVCGISPNSQKESIRRKRSRFSSPHRNIHDEGSLNLFSGSFFETR